MKKLGWAFALLLVTAAIAVGQPPEGGRGRGERDGAGPGRGGDFRPPPNPVVEALDTDGDHVISAEELKNASASLAKLDVNKDGKLTEEETRPRPPEGRGPGGPGPNGQGAQRGPRGDQQSGSRAPGDQPGARGRGGDRGPNNRGPEGRNQDPRGPEGPGGPQNHERFLEHAMEFDADKDGKLNRDELTQFAKSMAERRGGPEGRQNEQGGRGPNGGSEGRADGERPRRPD